MLKECQECTYRLNLSYEDLITVCGKCKLVKKADMVDHAEPKDPFKGKRWTKGKQTKLDYKHIKDLYKSGMKQKDIAELLNTTPANICYIIKKLNLRSE